MPEGAVLTPNKVERVRASVMVASSAVYTSLSRMDFALANADCRIGCTWFCTALSASADGVLTLRWCLGEVDRAVMVVAAVRGLSCAAPDIAAWDDGGNFPVSSSLRILDFKSSSSSQTVEGAVVDGVDSVPSARALSVSARARSVVSEVDGWRLLRMVDRAEWRSRRGS